MNDTTRIEALEIKCAHLEHGLQELSDVIVRQQQQIDQAQLQNKQLSRALESLEDRMGDPPADSEVPPHY